MLRKDLHERFPLMAEITTLANEPCEIATKHLYLHRHMSWRNYCEVSREILVLRYNLDLDSDDGMHVPFRLEHYAHHANRHPGYRTLSYLLSLIFLFSFPCLHALKIEWLFNLFDQVQCGYCNEC